MTNLVFRWLPPDEHKPEDLPASLHENDIVLAAFSVDRGPDRFYAVFGVGVVLHDTEAGNIDLSQKTRATPVCQAALMRAFHVAKRSNAKRGKERVDVIVVECLHEDTAWTKVRDALEKVPAGNLVWFCCKDSEVYDAAAVPLHYDPTLKRFNHEGVEIPQLTKEHRRALHAQAEEIKAALREAPTKTRH